MTALTTFAAMMVSIVHLPSSFPALQDGARRIIPKKKQAYEKIHAPLDVAVFLCL